MTETTKTENQNPGSGLTQRAVLLMAANFTAMAISFVLPLILTRIMSQSEFGLYKLSFQILATVLGLLNLQVAVSVFYFMVREPEKKLQVILNLVIFYGLAGSCVVLLFTVWPGVVTLISQSADLLIPHMPLLGLAILAWIVSINLESVPVAAGDVRSASVLIVAAQLIRSLLMIIAALAFGTLTAILLAAIIQGAVQIVLMMIYIRKRFGRIWARFDWPLFKAQITNALPFGIGGVAAVLQEDMHNYFVSSKYDAAGFAVYAVGCFQLPLLEVLNNSFSNALNPEIAENHKTGNYKGILDAWVHVVRSMAFILVPTFALLFVMRQEFITGLFSMTYAASVSIFAVNLLVILLKLSMHYPILRAFDEFRFYRFKLYVVLLPITFVALQLGWRAAGLVGIAAAVIMVRALDVAVIVRLLVRRMGLDKSDLRKLSPLLPIAGAAAIAAGITVLTRFMLLKSLFLQQLAAEIAPLVKRALTTSEWFSLLMLACCSMVFALAYILSAWLLGAVSESERAALRRLMSRIPLPRSNPRAATPTA
ncbi:MAG: lipopolysaccharide biosynthesis protein [Acidobacteriota bacterium]|nr:MAG: lipopolysaccharide biosynthesis protein [Acidobacteriota bacterium]